MIQIRGYAMRAVGEPLVMSERQVDGPGPGEAIVKVAGCGVCHTDLGFLYDGVPTRHPLPLILGHEISGFVEEAAPELAHLIGRPVVVPAVLPCGSCAACRAGHSMICRQQVMPGNDRDGGFATHVVLPGEFLCPLPLDVTDADAPLGDVEGLTLRHLAVVADAVSTPYQALQRAGLKSGDLVVIVGLGGVGGYAARVARARGATVVGVDIKPELLESSGLDLAIDARGTDARAMKKQIMAFAKERGAPTTQWIVAECSGTPAGQETAFGLLVHGATLCVVGFTPKPVSLRLSNLMAFDAKAIGNWGCAPSHYPAIIDMILAGQIPLVPHTELHPLSEIAQVFEAAHAHKLSRRAVLVPDL